MTVEIGCLYVTNSQAKAEEDLIKWYTSEVTSTGNVCFEE